MKVLFAAGGTGGHIFPAIAVADELKLISPAADILFVGAKGRMEEKIVPDNNYGLKTISVRGLNRKNIFKNISIIYQFTKALSASKKILKEFSPDVVVGTGGFVSAPVIYSAVKLNIPTLIQEGNYYPGLATKFLSSKVSSVVINFEETKKYLKRKDNVIRIAYPVRRSLIRSDRSEMRAKALKYFNMDNGLRTLLVFGGSQGAVCINSSIKKVISGMVKSGINVIWQTGKSDFAEIKQLEKDYIQYDGTLKVLEFIKDMNYAYSAADLAVCRAGISSIMELAMLKIPAILIPLSRSAENHQEKNALMLTEMSAVIMISEKDLSGKIGDTILDVINDDVKLGKLSENIGKAADPHSAEKILEEIFKIRRN